MEEGLEETLTVHRLGVGTLLRQTLASSNHVSDGTVSYDAAGNVMQDAFNIYTYGSQNQMIASLSRSSGAGDVKDAIKTVTRYNKRKAGSRLSASETIQVHCKLHQNCAMDFLITSGESTSLGA